jgi:hypothetical protein
MLSALAGKRSLLVAAVDVTQWLRLHCWLPLTSDSWLHRLEKTQVPGIIYTADEHSTAHMAAPALHSPL